MDATEGVALEPKTSASAIYLTDEDRHILSSYKDISIIDEKDKTSVNLFGPDVVVPLFISVLREITRMKNIQGS